MLRLEVEVPQNYGIWHISAIIIVVLLTTLFIKVNQKINEKQFRRIILFFWLSLIITESLKIYTFTYINGDYGEFEWHSFPFQFCSTILYSLPFIVFLKESKIRNAIISFCSTYMLSAGFLVYCYPSTIFVEYAFINFQTLYHHGLMIVLGIFIFVHYHNYFNNKMFLSGSLVFLAFMTIATLMNETFPFIFKDFSTNFFFIDRHQISSLPVLSIIQPLVPYPVFILIYYFGFTLIAYIIYQILKKTTKKFH